MNMKNNNEILFIIIFIYSTEMQLRNGMLHLFLLIEQSTILNFNRLQFKKKKKKKKKKRKKTITVNKC